MMRVIEVGKMERDNERKGLNRCEVVDEMGIEEHDIEKN